MATKTLCSKIVSTELAKTVNGQSEKLDCEITVQTDYDGTMIIQVHVRTSILKKKCTVLECWYK
jgi:hypothetical protein